MDVLSTVLQNLLSPTCLIFMFLGCLMGIIFGALPGLSGTVGVTLLLPMTYGLKSELGIALLISIWVGGVSGGFISATLLGIPGTTSCIATCFDAYPLSKQGKAKKALMTGIIASFIGTFFSCVIAMVLCKYVARIAMMLGPWEYFSLCLCAIVLVISLSKGNMFKGLAGAAIGLLLACVGAAPVDAVERFTFGNYNLYGGINNTAVMLGIFAIYLVVLNYAKGDTALESKEAGSTGGEGLTLKELKDNIVNMFRSDRKPDGVGLNSLLRQFRLRKLAVGGGCRMDDERTHVPHIGDMAEQLERIDELCAALPPALQPEGEHAARAFGQVFLCQRVIGAALQARIVDKRDLWMAFEVPGNGEGIFRMLLHPQRKGLDPL